MSIFDKREKAYEGKFAHEEKLSFEINAHRYKLLGSWAAEKLGKKGADADAYVKEIIQLEFEKSGEKGIVDKLVKDFGQAKIALTTKEIQTEMDRLLAVAKKQVMDAKK